MKLRNVYFIINSGYVWGHGLSKEQYEKFDGEMRHLFTKAGFEIIENKPVGNCPYFVKGKTKLYSHPMELSGCCDESQIEEIKEILSKGKTFRHYHTDIYEEIFDLDEEQELEYYSSKYGTTIQKTLMDLFQTDNENLFKYKNYEMRRLAESIAVKTVLHTIGTSDSDPSFQYVREEYKKLVDKGLLIETTEKTSNDTIELCRSINQKEIKQKA
jgi:hypothetical protein